MPQINNYRVADHDLQIIFEDSKYNSLALIDSFEPFRVEEVGQDLLFRLTIDDSLRPVPKVRRHRIRAFDTGNGDTTSLMTVAISISLRILMVRNVAC